MPSRGVFVVAKRPSCVVPTFVQARSHRRLARVTRPRPDDSVRRRVLLPLACKARGPRRRTVEAAPRRAFTSEDGERSKSAVVRRDLDHRAFSQRSEDGSRGERDRPRPQSVGALGQRVRRARHLPARRANVPRPQTGGELQRTSRGEQSPAPTASANETSSFSRAVRSRRPTTISAMGTCRAQTASAQAGTTRSAMERSLVAATRFALRSPEKSQSEWSPRRRLRSRGHQGRHRPRGRSLGRITVPERNRLGEEGVHRPVENVRPCKIAILFRRRQ